MFRPLSLFVGLRYTRARRRRQFISFISLTSMIGLGLGVLALILVLSVMNGFQQEMGTRILGLVPHVVLTAGQPLPDWPAVAKKALAEPGVEAAAPVTRMDGMLSFHGEMQPIEISGIDPAREPEVSSLADRLIGGQLQDLQPGRFGVIVGALTARRFGLALGDPLTLIVPEPSEAPGGITPSLHRLTVVGVFKAGADLDGSLAMVHLADAARMRRWPEGRVEGVRLKLADLHTAPELARRLAARLGPPFEAEDWTRSEGSLFSAMQMEKTMIGLLLLLIVAVAAFNIIATLIMVVADKRTDIAILRTLGATPGQIMRVFMIQGCIIGFSGTLAGAVLGVAAALHVSELVSWIEQHLDGRLLGSGAYFITSLPSRLQWPDVALVVCAGLLLSFLATLYPAWRAAQTHPAEALRYA
mgnify:CR=1 FL=1